jgi:hypothetical protein
VQRTSYYSRIIGTKIKRAVSQAMVGLQAGPPPLFAPPGDGCCVHPLCACLAMFACAFVSVV